MQKLLRHGVYFLTFICLLNITDAFIRTSESDQEEEVKIHVKIPDNGYRRRRSADDFPDEMDIDLPVEGDHVTLSLHRNYHINDQVPVTVQRNGKIIQQFLRQSQQKVEFYYDRASGSVFLVQRHAVPDFKDDFEFFGTFHVNGTAYFVQPPDVKHETHSISRVQDAEPVATDFLLSNDTDFQRKADHTTETSNSRRKRQTTLYETEVLMVADFSIFSYWKDRANGTTSVEKDENAKSLMRQYYAFLLSAIDLRYSSVTGDGYEVSILFAGLHIADTASDSTWTETIKNTATNPPQVDSSVALDNFRTWMNDLSGGGALPDHDHAMLFTRYDLERDGSNSVAGLAYVSRLCTASQQSINEDNFNPTIATIAAHELGHSLGASHDGQQDGNECPADLGYVMEASSGVSSDREKTLRLWEFSTCSIDYFTAYIDTLNTDNNNCMTSRSASYNASALDEYSTQLAGQIYTPDEQCESIEGPGSYMCRQFLYSNYSTICSYMPCARVPANNGTCALRIPMEGTSCGNGKVCEKGLCVEANTAPTGLTETCLFGDQPQTVANENLSCAELNQTKCYTKAEECCETCEVIAQSYTNLTDCPYGNRASGCGTFAGSICYTSEHNVDVCCELCQNAYTGIADCLYGNRASNCGTFAGDVCYVSDYNVYVCCELCQDAYTGIEDCLYGNRASNCGTFAGSVCYTSDNNVYLCCELCHNAYTGIEGCEYGDRASDCDYNLCQVYTETTRTEWCCVTCRNATESTSPATPPTTTTTLTTTTPIKTTTTPSITTTTPSTTTTSTLTTSTFSSTTTTPTITTTTPSTATTTTVTTVTSSTTDTTPNTTITTPSITTTTPSTTTTVSSQQYSHAYFGRINTGVVFVVFICYYTLGFY